MERIVLKLLLVQQDRAARRSFSLSRNNDSWLSPYVCEIVEVGIACCSSFLFSFAVRSVCGVVDVAKECLLSYAFFVLTKVGVRRRKP